MTITYHVTSFVFLHCPVKHPRCFKRDFTQQIQRTSNWSKNKARSKHMRETISRSHNPIHLTKKDHGQKVKSKIKGPTNRIPEGMKLRSLNVHKPVCVSQTQTNVLAQQQTRCQKVTRHTQRHCAWVQNLELPTYRIFLLSPGENHICFIGCLLVPRRQRVLDGFQRFHQPDVFSQA